MVNLCLRTEPPPFSSPLTTLTFFPYTPILPATFLDCDSSSSASSSPSSARPSFLPERPLAAFLPPPLLGLGRLDFILVTVIQVSLLAAVLAEVFCLNRDHLLVAAPTLQRQTFRNLRGSVASGDQRRHAEESGEKTQKSRRRKSAPLRGFVGHVKNHRHSWCVESFQ